MRCWTLAVCIATVAVLVVRLAAVPPPTPSRSLVLQAPPAASVQSVAVSADGSLVASASGEGGIRVYEAATGELLRVLGGLVDRGVVFSPDGRMVAAAGFRLDKLVELWDVARGKVVRRLPGHTQIESCAVQFSPDGKRFASAGRDSEILVWDLESGDLLYQLAGPPAVALAFSPDGRLLATGGCDARIRLWNTITGALVSTLEGHSDCVVTLDFSPDGQTLASGSCDWARHRGRNTAEFAWHDPGCESQWKLWDVANGRTLRSVTQSGRILSLDFAPDGRSLACAIGKEILRYDLRTVAPGRTVTRFDFDATSVAFTPDGMALVGSSHDQTVHRVNLSSGQLDWQAPGYYEQVNSVALSFDGSLLATASSDRAFAIRTLDLGAARAPSGALRLWDTRSGRFLRRLGDATDQWMAVAISPDGRQVVGGGAAGSATGVVRLYDAATGETVWSMAEHPDEVLTVAFAPEGSTLASGSADGLVCIRDAHTGASVHVLPDHPRGATSLVFSPDGTTLLCGDGQGRIHLWDTRRGVRIRDYQADDSQAASVMTDRLFTSIARSPDGTKFYACAATVGNTFSEPVRVWDTATGRLLSKIDQPRLSGRPIAVSPDGAILAAGGKTVELWDLRSGKPLRELFGHLKRTQSISFSPDGRLVYSGGSWGTTNVWEVATGRLLATWFAFARHDRGALADDWFVSTSDGYYDGSPAADRYVAWRDGDTLRSARSLGGKFRSPERVQATLGNGPAPQPTTDSSATGTVKRGGR